MTLLSDKELIVKLKQGGKAFEDTSMHMFNAYKGYISKLKDKLNLPQQQLQDAYADSLVKLIRQLKDGSFRGDSKISSYFYSIYYNACVDVTRKNASNKNKATLELLEFDAKEKDLMNMIEKKDQASQIISVIDKMGGVCQRILMDWAYYGYAMDEIASRSNLSSPESARSMKYKCLKKLRELLVNKQYTA